MPLEALIFDVDGTLAETEETHRRAFNQTFAALDAQARHPDPTHGWHWDRDLYRALLATPGGRERIAAYLRDWLGVDPAPAARWITDVHAAKTAAYARIVAREGLALRPGVGDLIADARARGLKVAVATTTSTPNVEALCLAVFGSRPRDAFDAVAAGDEVPRKKPAPDVYRLALERLGLPAPACVALEDSHVGLAAARAAGLRCVVSPGLYTRGEDVGGADAVVECFSAVAGVDALLGAMDAGARGA